MNHHHKYSAKTMLSIVVVIATLVGSALTATMLGGCSRSEMIKFVDSFRDKSKRESPQATATTSVGGATISVEYGQPVKKGREIFGALVPFGEVWRTGANEATEISLSKDVQIAGKTLKAGRYMLCTIPERDKWTVIFNNTLGQWDAFFYNASDDALRVSVPAAPSDSIVENLTIAFEAAQQLNETGLTIAWDKTKITVPIVIQ
jgi:hypothetical protein